MSGECWIAVFMHLHLAPAVHLVEPADHDLLALAPAALPQAIPHQVRLILPVDQRAHASQRPWWYVPGKITHLLHSSACDHVTIPRRPGYPPGGRHDNATTSAVHSVQDECTDLSCLLHAHACAQATRLGPTLPLAIRQQVVTSSSQKKSNANCYESVHVVRTWRSQVRVMHVHPAQATRHLTLALLLLVSLGLAVLGAPIFLCFPAGLHKLSSAIAHPAMSLMPPPDPPTVAAGYAPPAPGECALLTCRASTC